MSKQNRWPYKVIKEKIRVTRQWKKDLIFLGLIKIYPIITITGNLENVYWIINTSFFYTTRLS